MVSGLGSARGDLFILKSHREEPLLSKTFI